MKNNQVKETKQKKSFKEVVYDNRGKIIAIGGIAVAITVGIIVSKKYNNFGKNLTKIKNNTEKELVKVNAKNDLGLLIDNELWEKVTVTENIINNSGIIDQAKATVTRKRDTLNGKLNCLSNMKQKNDDMINKILELKAGIEAYDKMLDQYDELEYLYKCRTIGESLIED